MSKYISILRGINVSGKRKIRMADLREHLEKIGFSEVETYIQSGNVAFNFSDKPAEKTLVEKIEKAIADNYDFEVPVQVRSKEELEAVLNENPFLKEGVDTKKLHVTFLAETPTEEKIEKIQEVDYSPDKFAIIGRSVYIFCEKYGSTKLNNSFFERKLKVSATTRNWKTVNKLLEMTEA